MEIYLLLKSLHVVGVVLFLGNIIVTGWWKVMADRTRNPAIIAFAQRQVTLTDWVFTFGGSFLVGLAGIANVWLHDIALSTPWIQWGMALFTLSAVIWLAVLVPVQAKLTRLARDFAHGGPIPPRYWALERVWLVGGFLATVLPLAVVPVMVWKVG
ncbi:MAG: DUF2269 domain-containing protein [Rhodospirillaceae bacterium]|nr:DUF2269 domain-containing protein [Rhodospirillales bacterium]